MNHYFDTLETRDPEVRERDQLARLPHQIAHAKANAPAFARVLAGIEPDAIATREALARIPVTRKSELVELQKTNRPFGGLAATRWGDATRVFASPGPIYEPEGRAADYWRLARALYAAGFRRGDLVHNCFSYHFTPAGSMLETGAHALGCTVFAGGIGQSEQQVQAMAHLNPDGYVGTPSFLKIILDKADELGIELPSLTKALVSAEPFPPSLRDAWSARGIAGYQVYATADVGSIAYETPAREGLVVDEGVLVEIVRPGTGDPVPEGEVGEVVVTSFNRDYPMIRLATGDLSALIPGASPCGRTNVRIKGWMGRADQTAKVKGMFVHPKQVAEVAARHPELKRVRLVVDREAEQDTMTLLAECAKADAALEAAIAATLQSITKLKGSVQLVTPGTLPNDGKLIADERKS